MKIHYVCLQPLVAVSSHVQCVADCLDSFMYQCGSWRKIGDRVWLGVFLASDRHCQTVTTVCNLHVLRFKDDWCLLHPHITHRSSFRKRASFSQYISFDVVTWNTLNLWICLVLHACSEKILSKKYCYFARILLRRYPQAVAGAFFSLFYGIVPYDAAMTNRLRQNRRERLLVLLLFFSHSTALQWTPQEFLRSSL